MRSTTSSIVSPLVSIVTAPSAARSGPSTRVMSRRSRSVIEASTSSTAPPISPTRRSARTLGVAVMYSFKVALGNTTVPMSRPSMTPPPRSAAHCRWRARSSSRTGVLAAIALTPSVTSRAADVGGGVDAVDDDGVLVDGHVELAGECGNGVLIGDRDATAQGRERDGTVHRASVEVLEPESAWRPPCRRCSCQRRRGRRW